MIPWLKLIQHAPTILSLSRDLLQKTKRAGPPAPDVVQALTADLQEQAEVIHALAAQVDDLTAALLSLRRAAALAISLAAGAFLLATVALVLLFARWMMSAALLFA